MTLKLERRQAALLNQMRDVRRRGGVAMSRQSSGNLLLDRLSEPIRFRLLRRSCRVCVRPREILCDEEQPLQFIYFPVTGLIASVILLPDGAVTDSAMIGREGMVGIGLIAGELLSPYRVMQQIGGESIQVPASEFRDSLTYATSLRDLVSRYLLVIARECAQNAACNLHHTVRERMCRWILAAADRSGADELQMTREFLSEMLGVTRQTVSETAASLERAGLIRYEGRRLQILNRPLLRETSCDCYRAVSEVYRRIIGSLTNGSTCDRPDDPYA